MSTETYTNNPVWALRSGANTASCGFTKQSLQTGRMICHDSNGELQEFVITSATCELSETPTASSLRVYTDSGKETELTVNTDYTISGKEITVLRRDLFEVYCEYTYGTSATSKTETLQLDFATNGDLLGILLNDNTDTSNGADVAFAIGGYIKRDRVVNWSEVYETYMPKAIILMD